MPASTGPGWPARWELGHGVEAGQDGRGGDHGQAGAEHEGEAQQAGQLPEDFERRWAARLRPIRLVRA